MAILSPTISEDINYLDVGKGFTFTFQKKDMQSITPWNSRFIDIFTLPVVSQYSLFVFETRIDGFPAIAKFARFQHELIYYQQETDIYR